MRQSSLPIGAASRPLEYGPVAPRRAFSEGGNGNINVMSGNRTGSGINMSQLSGQEPSLDMKKYAAMDKYVERLRGQRIGNVVTSVGESFDTSYGKIKSQVDTVSGSVGSTMAAIMKHVQVEPKPVQSNHVSGGGMSVEFVHEGVHVIKHSSGSPPLIRARPRATNSDFLTGATTSQRARPKCL
jgi:hypothetical protein